MIGAVVRHFFDRWGRGKILTFFDTTPESDAEKIGFLYARAVLSLLGLLIQLAVAALLVVTFDMGRTDMKTPIEDRHVTYLILQ